MAKTQSKAWTKLFPEPVPVGDGLALTADVSPERDWMAVSLVETQPRGSRAVFRVEDFLAGNSAKTGSTAANCKGYNRGAAHDAAYTLREEILKGLK